MNLAPVISYLDTTLTGFGKEYGSVRVHHTFKARTLVTITMTHQIAVPI